jgi:hypothetical protein
MGVITVPTYEAAENEAGLEVVDIPDANAYGLAVSLDTTAEVTSTDWSYFYDGTLVIDEQANILYCVVNGGLRTMVGVTFTSTTKGLVPPSGGGTVNFLRADGQWARPVAVWA